MHMRTYNKYNHKHEKRERVLFIRKDGQAGFLHLIGMFVIFAGLVWYFNIDVRGFVDSHLEVKNFFIASKDMLVSFFTDYFKPILSYVWNNIWLDVIWKNIKGLIVPV